MIDNSIPLVKFTIEYNAEEDSTHLDVKVHNILEKLLPQIRDLHKDIAQELEKQAEAFEKTMKEGVTYDYP